uniref:MMPL family transporter n=1 Tax=Aldersonia kunmingensis TaxID=408066 RepID=UPI000A763E91
MATYLYRIGRFAYRRKGVVLSIWIALLVLFGVGAATLAGPTSESFSIPGTQAQQAQDLMAQRFPGAADPMNAIGARYVFAAPAGQTLDEPQNRAAIDKVIAKASTIPQVQDQARDTLANPVATDGTLTDGLTGRDLDNAKATSPLSPDRTVGYVDVPMTGDYSDVDDALVSAVGDAAQVGRDAGLTVEVSGAAAKAASAPGGATELVGIAVAAVVLMITFGSMVAAGLPLITAIIGIAIGSMGITIATGFAKLSAMTP